MNRGDRESEREAKEFIAAAPRSNPGESPVDFCRRVLDAKTAMVWVGDGPETLVDTFSASAVVAVADKLTTDSAREKLAAASLAKAVQVCIKLCSKVTE